MIALADAGGTAAVRDAAAEAVRWTPGVTITDLTPRYAALGLLGPATASAARRAVGLGSLEPVRRPAFDVTRLASVP